MRRISAVTVFRALLVFQGVVPAYFVFSPFDLGAETDMVNENYYGYNMEDYFLDLFSGLQHWPEWLNTALDLFLGWLTISLASLYYVSLVLLWCFSSAGKLLLVLVNVVGILATGITGLVVLHPIDQAVTYIVQAGQGALLAMAYGGGLAWKFAGSPVPDRQAGRDGGASPELRDPLRGATPATT